MHSSKSRAITGVILAFLALLGIMFHPISLLRTSAAEDYRQWRQMDERWANINLGNSSDIMAWSGCLVTSTAILAVHSGAKDANSFNPGTFVQSLNSVNAFDNYGCIASWSKVTEVIPEVKFVQYHAFSSATQSGMAAEMKAIQNNGYYMICNVGGHWVFIDSIVGDEVYMIDPAKDDTKLFSSYSISGISGVNVYIGKNKPVSTSPVVQVTPNTAVTTASSATTTTITTTTTTTTTAKLVTNTTTTTTTAVETTTEAVTTVNFEFGEYYNSGTDYVKIYSQPDKNSDTLYIIYSSQVVKIVDAFNGMGCVALGSEVGWVDVEQLVYAGNDDVHKCGDINGDNFINRLDLALLNEYLTSRSKLPEGISTLRECEIVAADINSDGDLNNLDILEYLTLFCK